MTTFLDTPIGAPSCPSAKPTVATAATNPPSAGTSSSPRSNSASASTSPAKKTAPELLSQTSRRATSRTPAASSTAPSASSARRTSSKPSGSSTTGIDGTPDYEAFNTYRRHRYRQQAYGRWNPWTDADIVRAHLADLARENIGAERAAELAGVSPATVRNIIWGLKDQPLTAKVRTVIAEKILAVQPGIDALAAGTRMDATGARRRIQALAVRGFPLGWLAERLDVFPGNISRILRRDTVEAATHRAIAALYEQLQNTDPSTLGVSRHGSNYIRNRAVREGWAPPAAWDDIDDPNAKPHGVLHSGSRP